MIITSLTRWPNSLCHYKSVDDVKESFELAVENIKSLEAEIGFQAKKELFEKRS